LRGIAAAAVMLYHYSAWQRNASAAGLGAPGATSWFQHGDLGVELFFIISGFVIFMTLEQTASLWDFVAARFARLYPAFLASMVTTILVTSALHYDRGQINLVQVIENLSMFAQRLGGHDIDGSYWTLWYELGFYTLAALCCLVMRWRSPELPCAVWLAAEFLLRACVGATPIQPIMQLTQTSCAHLFIIGIMLYRLHAGRATPLTALLLVSAIAMAVFGPPMPTGRLTTTGYMCAVAGLALLVWIATTAYGRLLQVAPLLFLGRISYPLYLVHQNAGSAVLARLEAAGLNPNVALVMTAILAIVIAWTISTLVEWPAQRWRRVRFAAYRERSSVGSGIPQLFRNF
jgi:peptidoglycan/LPS O-acetylase OafA/YrhL